MNQVKQAKLVGTEKRGALGEVPVIQVDGPKPKLTNNGYNCFSGQAKLHVPGLRNALVEYDNREGSGNGAPQGHVILKYADGGEFGSYTGLGGEEEIYSFW